MQRLGRQRVLSGQGFHRGALRRCTQHALADAPHQHVFRPWQVIRQRRQRLQLLQQQIAQQRIARAMRPLMGQVDKRRHQLPDQRRDMEHAVPGRQAFRPYLLNEQAKGSHRRGRSDPVQHARAQPHRSGGRNQPLPARGLDQQHAFRGIDEMTARVAVLRHHMTGRIALLHARDRQ